MARSLSYYGEYLQSELTLLQRFIRPGGSILEAGAGIGVNTIFMAECVGPTGHVLAYEPDPYFHRIALENLSANRVKNVTLLNRNIAGRQIHVPSPTEVAADTIDAVRLPRLDWIKVNSSARSMEVVRGAQATLWRLRPWLFVAAQTREEIEAYEEAVRDCGYQTRQLSTPLFNLQNYNGRVEDVFAGTSAIALISIPEEIEVDINLGAAARVTPETVDIT